MRRAGAAVPLCGADVGLGAGIRYFLFNRILSKVAGKGLQVRAQGVGILEVDGEQVDRAVASFNSSLGDDCPGVDGRVAAAW